MQNKPFFLGQIAFINTWPVYYGLHPESCNPEIQIIARPPSALNAMLHNKEIDLSAISAAEYALHFQEYKLIPHLSISSCGEVGSVCWYSRIPFSDLHHQKFLVTEDSLTSVWLSKILFQKMLGISPDFIPGKVTMDVLSDTDCKAFLCIGDQALRMQNQAQKSFPYYMDLGKAWYTLTQKPFVFGVWAARKDSLQEFSSVAKKAIEMLYRSKEQGMKSLDILSCKAAQILNLSYDSCLSYFQHLQYDLSPENIEGMKLFFHDLYDHSLIPKAVEIEFWE
ncbi:MAG: menaquinone biosynthesis protein [Candidatus Brocadiae bacterium]|nr:menaquinone biosynthesis protein [Candidatus Brocadiia bacterium]